MNVINGKLQGKQKSLQLDPMQLAAMLVFDGCMVALQTGANQLGGFLKLKREADILVGALDFLNKEKTKLMNEWSNKLVIAPANAITSIAETP